MTTSFRDDLRKYLQDPEFAKKFGIAQTKSSFALTLAEARKKMNLTQKELAARLNVSQSYVAKLEGGEANPTLGRIGSLLAVLGLSLTTGTTSLYPYSVTSDWITDWARDVDIREADNLWKYGVEAAKGPLEQPIYNTRP